MAGFSRTQGQNNLFDVPGQFLGLIHRDEMPAARDDLKLCICYLRHNLAFVLLSRVERIQFARQNE